MPRPKKPHVATLEQVRIRREGTTAIIEFITPGTATTHLELGQEVGHSTDEEILEQFNAAVRLRDLRIAAYHHKAIEIPPGRPQVEYHEQCDQWVPRGHVLRTVVSDGGLDGQATIDIDDREFSLAEFGRMLTTFAGWGMRISFVPAEEIESEPKIEVRNPTDRRQL